MGAARGPLCPSLQEMAYASHCCGHFVACSEQTLWVYFHRESSETAVKGRPGLVATERVPASLL